MIRNLAILLMLLIVACEERGRETTLPSLPDVALASFEPAVRRQLEEALLAARSQPRSGEVNRRLGMLLHAYGWLPQASICYQRATLLDRRDLRAHYYLARLQIDSGETDAARETVAGVVAAQRGQQGDVPTLILLGGFSFDEGNLAAALRWYEMALERSPNSLGALLGVGQVRCGKGDVPGAIEAYRKALEIAPDLRQAAYRLALVYRARGDLEEAKRYFEQHAAGEGNSPLVDPHLEALERLRIDAEHVYRRANGLAKSGRNDAAIQLYRKVLKLNPDLTAASYNIGLALLRMEKPEDAVPYLKGFLETRPNHVDAHNNLGLCFLELGRPDDAVACFESALAIESSYYKAHFNLGLVLARPGVRDPARIAAARKHFLAALSILPDYPEAHYNLALLSLREGNRERARTHLLAALDTEPEHRGAHGTLRELVGERVSSPVAYRRVASLLHDQRRFAAAVHALRESLRTTQDWRNGVTLAWILATCPDESVRRPAESTRLMESICGKVAREDPRALDTLAAAYAAAGEFEPARVTAASALEFARAKDTPAMRSLAERIEFRLRLYEGNRAFYEK